MTEPQMMVAEFRTEDGQTVIAPQPTPIIRMEAGTRISVPDSSAVYEVTSRKPEYINDRSAYGNGGRFWRVIFFVQKI